MEGTNVQYVLCEKSEVIYNCLSPVEELLGKCLRFSVSPVLPIMKSLNKDLCENRLYEWIETPLKYQCLAEKINDTQICTVYFGEAFANKESTSEILKAALEILTTDKNCDEIKLAKRCFNNVIKDCTEQEKNATEIIINALTHATKCSGARANSLSAFLCIVVILSLLKKLF